MQKWLAEHVSREQVVLTSNGQLVLNQAVLAGVGVGFFVYHEAMRYPELRQVLPEWSWEVTNWVLTHGDLHRSEKVQAFLGVLKIDEYQNKLAGLLNWQPEQA